MGEILGFAHLAINAKDWERSLWFYGELLGFPLSAPVAMNGFSLTYAAVPGGGNIELFKNREVLSDRTQKDEATIGLRHFAFEVSGLQSLRDKLVAHGIPLALDVTDLPALGIKVILFEDPNGVTLEFAERTS